MKHRLLYAVAAGIPVLSGLVLLAFCYPSAQRFFPGCPMFRYLNLYCPGCGGTRALYHLLHGDLAGTFRCNLMLVPALIVCAALIFRPELQRKYVLLICFAAATILFAILRNIPVYPFILLVPNEL